MYVLKTIKCAFSKFDTLHQRNQSSGEWEQLTPKNFDPYYACALFSINAHVPIPILLGRSDRSPIQSLICNLLAWLPAMRQARQAAEQALDALDRATGPDRFRYRFEEEKPKLLREIPGHVYVKARNKASYRLYKLGFYE